MCLAKKYAEQINEIIDKVHNDFHRLSEEQSNIEKELNQKYHELETAKFNAYEGYCFAKSLQHTLQKRRLIKHEISQLRRLHDTIYKHNLKQMIKNTGHSIDQSLKGNMVYTEGFDVSIGDVLKEKLQLN